jgi:hypothetical protein
LYDEQHLQESINKKIENMNLVMTEEKKEEYTGGTAPIPTPAINRPNRTT